MTCLPADVEDGGFTLGVRITGSEERQRKFDLDSLSLLNFALITKKKNSELFWHGTRTSVPVVGELVLG